MKFFKVYPQVAGDIGDNTLGDTSARPMQLEKLHYDFVGWLGDSVLTSIGNYVVTVSLMKRIEAAGLTGVEFDEVEITKSEEFEEMYPDITLPPFVWMKPKGRVGVDDFGFSPLGFLIVSEAALAVLKQEPLQYAEIEEYPALEGKSS